MRIPRLLLIIHVAVSAFVSPAAAEKRVALVIGESGYLHANALQNPKNDAEAIGGVLRGAGFDEVRVETDLGVSSLRRALREFAERAADADIAVVFYAGHGVEVEGKNYLVPVDASLASDYDVEDETIALERVLQALDPVKRLKLAILDACRENPFAARMRRTTASRSLGRGLAPPPERQGGATLVAYAARAGSVASDGTGRNSPFASALLHHLATPGLDVRLALGKVRDEVLAVTNGRQEPFLYGSLGGDNLALASAGAPIPPSAPVVLGAPSALPLAPKRDESLRERLTPQSFKLAAAATSTKANLFDWRTSISYTLINDSGMSLYMGILMGSASIGTCSDIRSAHGGLQLLPGRNAVAYAIDLSVGPPHPVFVPAGARVSGVIAAEECSAPNPGSPTAPFSMSLMIGETDAPKTMIQFPVSTDAAVRRMGEP